MYYNVVGYIAFKSQMSGNDSTVISCYFNIDSND